MPNDDDTLEVVVGLMLWTGLWFYLGMALGMAL